MGISALQHGIPAPPHTHTHLPGEYCACFPCWDGEVEDPVGCLFVESSWGRVPAMKSEEERSVDKVAYQKDTIGSFVPLDSMGFASEKMCP